MTAWPQLLTFGVATGLFAVVTSSSYDKWFAPRLSKRAAAAGAIAANLIGFFAPFGVAVVLGWLPAFTLPFMLVGAAVGLAFASCVRTLLTRERH